MGKFKNLLALILSISLFSLYGFNIYAADAPLQQEQNFLYDGYTEEGVYYVVYSITTFQSDTNQKARIVVSRTVETKIAYEGHITPPSTYYYSTFDTGYNIQMSGTLNLISSEHDIWPFFPKSTVATYRGVIFGNL